MNSVAKKTGKGKGMAPSADHEEPASERVLRSAAPLGAAPTEPITLADLRAVLPGGDGFSGKYGLGLATALDVMTAASRDLDMVSCALQHGEDNSEVAAQVVLRISLQLKEVAMICYRVARDEAAE